MKTKTKQENVDEQVTSSRREQRLVLGSSGVQEPEQEKCGTTHYAGCACHERGWENKWKAAIEIAARAEHERIERLESMIGKWLEWARMHGHLEHAAGIADDSRRLISPENVKGMARREGGSK